jgi:SAM-dependent methyltransferase
VTSEVARLFDAMAGAYEELEPWYEHLYARLHAILRDVLAPPPGGARPRALDAGCGTGFQTALLADLGYETHGIDISPRLLALARGRRPGVPLVRGSIEALPYADASFGAVTCCGSTLSFVEAPARALAEIGRVLRPGGRVLLECEHKWSLDLAWALVSALTGDALGYGVSIREAWRPVARPPREGFVATYPGYGALRFFTLAELDAMLAAAGLTRRRVWGVHALTNLIPSTVLHRARLGRRLARLFAMLCRADALLARTGLERRLANSLVILAERSPDGRRAGEGGRASSPRPRQIPI